MKWLNNEYGGERVDFSYDDLRGADFSGADLRNVDFRKAILIGADFSGADLRSANLSGAILRSADFRGANLRGANIDFASWPMWCGSIGVIEDEKISLQHLAHWWYGKCDDPKIIALKNIPEIIDALQDFHHLKECGEIKHIELNSDEDML